MGTPKDSYVFRVAGYELLVMDSGFQVADFWFW